MQQKDYKDWRDYPDYVKENILSYHNQEQTKKLGLVLNSIDNMILQLLVEKKNIRQAVRKSRDYLPELNLTITSRDSRLPEYTFEQIKKEEQDLISQITASGFDEEIRDVIRHFKSTSLKENEEKKGDKGKKKRSKSKRKKRKSFKRRK